MEAVLDLEGGECRRSRAGGTSVGRAAGPIRWRPPGRMRATPPLRGRGRQHGRCTASGCGRPPAGGVAARLDHRLRSATRRRGEAAGADAGQRSGRERPPAIRAPPAPVAGRRSWSLFPGGRAGRAVDSGDTSVAARSVASQERAGSTVTSFSLTGGRPVERLCPARPGRPGGATDSRRGTRRPRSGQAVRRPSRGHAPHPGWRALGQACRPGRSACWRAPVRRPGDAARSRRPAAPP